VIAFALPEILHQWGSHIHEIQLDSACDFLLCQADETQLLTLGLREYKQIML